MIGNYHGEEYILEEILASLLEMLVLSKLSLASPIHSKILSNLPRGSSPYSTPFLLPF
jgi:hypothetical protein